MGRQAKLEKVGVVVAVQLFRGRQLPATAITRGKNRQWNLGCLRRERQIIHKLFQLDSALLTGWTTFFC